MKKSSFFILILLLAVKSFAQQIIISNLQCEQKKDPLAINTASPHFSWQLQSAQRNVLQTAYRILIADKIELLQKDSGNIWDSKKINSNQSIQIGYAIC